MHKIFMMTMLLSSMVAACTGPNEADVADAERALALQPLSFAAMDLISPATCELRNGKLRNCSIAERLNELLPIDTAVPLRTVTRAVKSGNCSTQFPLAVTVGLDGDVPVTFHYLSESMVILRRPGGVRAASVKVRDGSPWTPTAVLDGSCRIALEVAGNQVDVDTVEQARAIIAAIEQELAAANQDKSNYEQLIALQAAYTFTKALADFFHIELSNETMQTLRRAAIDAGPAMETAIMGCGGALSPEQRDTLFQLYVSMVALGDPATWRKPDGTTKSLEDFYGAGAAAVLARLREMAEHADPDLATQYREGFEAAAAEVVRLEAKLTLARTQLAAWLGGAP